MRAALRLLRRIGSALGAVILIALIGFGFVQTSPGRAWLERTIAAAASTPDRHLAIAGLAGLVPLRFSVERIAIADHLGTWASLRHVTIEVRVRAFFAGRVEIPALTIGAADLARLPAGAQSSSSRQYDLRLPRLPVAGVALDRFSIGRLTMAPPVLGEPVAAALAGHAAIANRKAEAALDLSRIDGQAGNLALTMALAGAQPKLRLHLAANEPSGLLVYRLLGRSDRLPLTIALDGSGPLADWRGRLAVSAGGLARIDARLTLAVADKTVLRLSGAALAAALFPARFGALLGDRIGFLLQVTKAPDRIVVDRLSVDLAAGELTGSGAVAGSSVAAELRADVPVLARIGRVSGVSAEGAATLAARLRGTTEKPVLDATLSARDLGLRGLAPPPAAANLTVQAHAEWHDAAGFTATADGAADGVRAGLAAADALVGGKLAVTAAIRRDPSGTLHLDRLALSGSGARVSGEGSFAPASRQAVADLAIAVPELKPLGALFGGKLAGTADANARLTGPLDRPRLDGAIEVRNLSVGGAAIDELRVNGQVPDLAVPQAALDGRFRTAGMAGTMALAAELRGSSELIVPRLRLAAADGSVDGAVQVALDTGLVRGSLRGRVPNLAPWSRLFGVPLDGSAEFAAGFEARGGQAADLTLTGSELAFGAGASRVAVGHADLGARLADILGVPTGSGRLALTGIRSGKLALGALNFAFETLRPGRFAFQGDTKAVQLALAFAGDAGREPAGLGLGLSRLGGTVAGAPFRLDQPLVFSWHGADLALSGLALSLGPGRLSGNGSLRGQSLALRLTAADLPLAPGAGLVGHPNVHGALSFSATVGGALAAPRGHLSAQIRGLGLAPGAAAHVPRIGLSLSADWNGRSLDLDGRVGGLAGATARFGGTVPLLLTARPFDISVPLQGRLALRLQGAGEIGRLAELLPIGEDRLAGRFAADLTLGGTLAAPSAGGRLSLSGGRYENFATGAVLTGIDAVLGGDRDHLTLASFSAADSAGGRVTAQGGIALNGTAGPTASLTARLSNFRVAARDEAVVTTSGQVSVGGPLTALAVKAPLTIDRADINLPENLPPEIVALNVVRIGGESGGKVAPAAVPAPVLPASLDIGLEMPGRVFVRGHGLDSEWRGRLKITGTLAAPRIAGSLDVIRGSFSLLGKSFRLSRGRIVFEGGAKPDPLLDITAEIVTADIVAQITIGGLASAPKITLSSTPPLPQDEILSRVLFNQGKGQLSAAQGLELAQAAAALAGQNFGMLERLRGSLGLDWLGFGSGPQGAAPSIVNPKPQYGSQVNAGGGAFSAGKYIAPGVSIGVTQGVSPPTSKVTVEIELGHHLTIGTSAGQNGGTGIGLNYNYDY
jgi:translocation and assembly module TamB